MCTAHGKSPATRGSSPPLTTFNKFQSISRSSSDLIGSFNKRSITNRNFHKAGVACTSVGICILHSGNYLLCQVNWASPFHVGWIIQSKLLKTIRDFERLSRIWQTILINTKKTFQVLYFLSAFEYFIMSII